MTHPRLEDIVEPGFLDDLPGRSLEDIRLCRDRAGEVEAGLSYLRRMVQGRLDIVLAERDRRLAGEPPEDLAHLVGRLPEILSEHIAAPQSAAAGRLSDVAPPEQLDTGIEGRIEGLVPTATMAHLGDLTGGDLDAAADGLAELERGISAERHAFHSALDALQAEIVRRYRSGEASVDTLLQ